MKTETERPKHMKPWGEVCDRDDFKALQSEFDNFLKPSVYLTTNSAPLAYEFLWFYHKQSSLLQERDTLKKDVEFLRSKINEIEKENRKNGHARLKVEEANKELIEALELAKEEIKSVYIVTAASDAHFKRLIESSPLSKIESALLKHRKGE